MIYRECLKNENSHSSITFNSLTELNEKLNSFKKSNIKKISLIKDEIIEVNPVAARNLILDCFAGTEVEIIMYI